MSDAETMWQGKYLSVKKQGTWEYASRARGIRESVDGEVLVISGGHNAEASGASAAGWLVDHDRLPTAVVGLSDVLALGALRELDSRGLIAPADVSVCGFDDIPAARANELSVASFISAVAHLLAEGLQEEAAVERLHALWPAAAPVARQTRDDDLLSEVS